MRDAMSLVPPADGDDRSAPPTSSPSLESRLDSWKEIAAYLGRELAALDATERQAA